ncbi:MAG: class I SAM-dependent methyltransferase [Armatimonadetes bacterium]|nr:class I SAM-dependent methyltransferase [Armatimonadota bacterium]
MTEEKQDLIERHADWPLAWYLNSNLRRVAEKWVLRDLRQIFLAEMEQQLAGNEQILDVGSWPGHFGIELAIRLSKVRVIYLEDSGRNRARLQLVASRKGITDRVEIRKGNITSIPVPESGVDMVICNGAFHELPDPRPALAEFCRVVRPGGKVVVTDFKRTHLSERIEKMYIGADAHGPFDAEEMRNLFKHAGLSEIRIRSLKHCILAVGSKR